MHVAQLCQDAPSVLEMDVGAIVEFVIVENLVPITDTVLIDTTNQIP